MSLSPQVAAFLTRHKLLDSCGLVAVSGGPDSVALLHLLNEQRSQGRIARLLVGHVNHQLRGDESDADEAFVQQLAEGANLACRTTRIDVHAIAGRERDNLESIARRERYAWLAQVACAEGAAWIATGHTANDQAETVLFRLLRGSGIDGLRGIAECRPLDEGVALVRPLLGVRRHALLDYLHRNQIPYRIDSSNQDLGFARNRLRLELLPLLQQHYSPGVVEVMCRLAEQAQEWSTEINAEAERLRREAELPRAGAMLVFSTERLHRAPVNLVRQMFRRVWEREGWPMGDMDFGRWQRLVEIASGHCPAGDLPGRIHVRRVRHVVQIFPFQGNDSGSLKL